MSHVSLSAESFEVSTAYSFSQEEIVIDDSSEVETAPTVSETKAPIESFATDAEPGPTVIVVTVEVVRRGPDDVNMGGGVTPITMVEGLPWHLKMERGESATGVDSLMVELFVSNESPLWSCEAVGTITLLHPTGEHKVFPFDKKFNGNGRWKEALISVAELAAPANPSGFVSDSKIIIEAKFIVKNLIGLRKTTAVDFTSPSHLTDGILFVEGRKLYVSKQLLALHSSYFDQLFYGDFNDKMQDEVEIKDVSYEAFVELLDMIYPSGAKFSAAAVEGLLTSADRFGVEEVLDKAQQFLLATDEMSVGAKLLLADRFRLCALQGNCISKLTTTRKVKDLAATAEYKQLSATLKVVILEKLLTTDDDDEDEEE